MKTLTKKQHSDLLDVLTYAVVVAQVQNQNFNLANKARRLFDLLNKRTHK